MVGARMVFAELTMMLYFYNRYMEYLENLNFINQLV